MKATCLSKIQFSMYERYKVHLFCYFHFLSTFTKHYLQWSKIHTPYSVGKHKFSGMATFCSKLLPLHILLHFTILYVLDMPIQGFYQIQVNKKYNLIVQTKGCLQSKISKKTTHTKDTNVWCIVQGCWRELVCLWWWWFLFLFFFLFVCVRMCMWVSVLYFHWNYLYDTTLVVAVVLLISWAFFPPKEAGYFKKTTTLIGQSSTDLLPPTYQKHSTMIMYRSIYTLL